MKVYFAATELCSRRKLDEERTKNYFQKNGNEIAWNAEEADYIVFTTCAFRKNRVEESRMRLEQLLSHDTSIIVTGCFPDMESSTFEMLRRSNVVTLSPSHLEDIDELFPEFPAAFRDIEDANDFDRKNDNNVFFLRIANGCQFRCSYCTIKKAIGPLRSVGMHDLMNRIEVFLDSGKKHLVLIGDDVGSYGRDNGGSLPELLILLADRLKAEHGQKKVKIGNLNPWWLLEYREPLFRLLGDEMFTFMHISVQSGSDRILRLMNRDYCRSEEMREVLTALKDINPEISLQTDFIAGFPTESEEDFDRSLELVDKGIFDIINFHKYYETEGTDSLNIMPKVDPDVIEERYRKALNFIEEKNILCSIETEVLDVPM